MLGRGRTPHVSVVPSHARQRPYTACFRSAEPCSAEASQASPLPSMARHYTPSLSRSEGEGWGGGLLAGNAPCRAWLGTTPPPFRAAKGRAGEGCSWLGMPPAEHGSALRPLPFAQRRGGPGMGALGWECPLAEHGSALPPPFRAAKGRAGEGCFWLGMPPAEHGSALPHCWSSQRYTTCRNRTKLRPARLTSTTGLANQAYCRPNDCATQSISPVLMAVSSNHKTRKRAKRFQP